MTIKAGDDRRIYGPKPKNSAEAIRLASLRIHHAAHYLEASLDDMRYAGMKNDTEHIRQLMRWSLFAADDAAAQLRSTMRRKGIKATWKRTRE